MSNGKYVRMSRPSDALFGPVAGGILVAFDTVLSSFLAAEHEWLDFAVFVCFGLCIAWDTWRIQPVMAIIVKPSLPADGDE